ncbi:MAG: DUF6429 family protein [Wenzhouxiangella sp.]|jgi:hypothetical protein|nr:DUF6429 family protein [Wenzhouxiangella sp.]
MPIPDTADQEKLAEAALAILWLGVHEDKYGTRVWKGMDWDLMAVLFEKGWISDPKSKAKSVVLTEEGESLAQKLFEKHFAVDR